MVKKAAAAAAKKPSAAGTMKAPAAGKKKPVKGAASERVLAGAKALVKGKAPPIRSRPKKAKPVLYLYPASPCEASVTLRLTDGSRFTTLLPPPQSGGVRRAAATWLIAAERDGTLQPPTGPPVSSLCWEATPSEEARLLPKGAKDTFCVAGSAAGEFLLNALRAWGLQPREYTECASYWAPLMAEHSFVHIRVLPQPEWEELAPLTVTGVPSPLLCIRIFIAWRGLRGFEASKHLGSLPPPPPPRSASSSYAVEWGGQQLE